VTTVHVVELSDIDVQKHWAKELEVGVPLRAKTSKLSEPSNFALSEFEGTSINNDLSTGSDSNGTSQPDHKW
jgi:hypothetical protein